jgi:hypothetical protein
VVHALHYRLQASFAHFFEKEADALGPIPYHAVPDGLPRPVFGLAISPGCGLNGAIPFEHDTVDLPDTPLDELYFPAGLLQLEIGDQDTVPDHCTYEVPGYEGTRQYQDDEVAKRMGLDPTSRYLVDIHPGGEHDLIGGAVTGPLVLDRFGALLRERLR